MSESKAISFSAFRDVVANEPELIWGLSVRIFGVFCVVALIALVCEYCNFCKFGE